jgi:predicted O-methyltransferase YrrM
VAGTLDRLHEAARRDWLRGIGVVPAFLWSKLSGRSFMKMVTPAQLKSMYIPVSRQGGQLLYALTRGAGARRVVEFGASFGISTLYLAAAVRDNGGGRVITTEIEPSKCRAVADNLRAAGLEALVELREGDARETLRALEAPVDVLFLDGWKDLYLPILELVAPVLRAGGMVVADNIDFPEVRAYLARVRGGGEFVSAPLSDGRMELSVRV